MSKASDIQRDIADAKSWQAFGKKLGWRLRGFTYDRVADFYTSDDSGPLLVIHKHEREDIEAAITSAAPADSGGPSDG